MRTIFIAAAAATLIAGTAQAAVIVDVQQSGGDVVIDYSGSISLNGMSFEESDAGVFAFVIPSGGSLFNEGSLDYDAYAYFVSGSPPLGAGALSFATSASGDAFGFDSTELIVPEFYVGGTALSGQMVFAGATLASLGFQAGTYVTALPDDTITVNVGATADVPLPAAAPLLLGALALTGFAARRRKG